MEKFNFFIFSFVILFCLGNAQAQTTVSPWKFHEGNKGIITFKTNFNGDPAAYKMASIPDEQDKGWGLAPIDASDQVSFNRTSNLTCGEQLDFTYFQSVVHIPPSTDVKKFTVSYTNADDGARIYIFNSKYPEGIHNPKADLIYKKQENPGAIDLREYVSEGKNRVVIVQFDDCRTGNNVNGIHIKVNGEEIKTSDPNTVTDYCGKTYETVEYNGRTWLKTNVQVPKSATCCESLINKPAGRKKNSPFWRDNYNYANPDDPNAWRQIPFYSSFNDDPKDKHGGIFNYFATESCDICPNGFRVPTAEEFMDMANAIGGKELAKKADEDWGAIGRIDGYGSVVRGRFGEYWTSSPSEEGHKAKAFVLNGNGAFNISSEDKRTGCYVRCIKVEHIAKPVIELKAKEFKVNAFSVHQGKGRGQWYFGYNNNDQKTARIVDKDATGVTVLTIEKITIKAENALQVANTYAFKIKGTDNYLAVEEGGGERVFIKSYPSGPPVEAQFRNHPAFTKEDGAEQFSSFESISKPAHFLRHAGYILFVHKEQPSELYKQDASWKIEEIK